MPLVQSHLPDLHPWIESMYGGTTHLFYGDPTLPDLPPTKIHCRRGLRLHGAVSDKVRDELCFVLERCGIRTIAERPLSHRQMTSFRQREGACLLKTPHLVLQDFHAPRSFTIIDIKIVDPSAACRFLRQSNG